MNGTQLYNFFLWMKIPLSSFFLTQSVYTVCKKSKERKQISNQIYYLLFWSRGYTLRVIIELIYCTVTFLAHCISPNGPCLGKSLKVHYILG